MAIINCIVLEDLRAFMVEFVLELEIFQTKKAEKIETHIYVL